MIIGSKTGRHDDDHPGMTVVSSSISWSHPYLTTMSARTTTDCGTVMPGAFAALRSIAISNWWVGEWACRRALPL